jgi:hypothetical protein
MTIIQFNNNAQYKSPDITMINASSEKMLKLNAEAVYAFKQTRYLPSVHAKSTELNAIFRTCKYQLDETIQALEYETSDALNTLHRLRVALPDSASNKVREERTYYRNETVSALKVAIKQGAQDAQSTFKRLADVRFDSALTSTYQTALDGDVLEMNRVIADSDEKLVGLTASRKTLNDGMAVLEKTNFADIGKETLLSVENISAMAIPAPEIEILKLAISHLKKMMDDISNGLNYLALYEQRERLNAQIKALIHDQSVRIADVKAAKAKITLIKSTHGLYETFFIARAELAKLNESITAFANHLEQGEQQGYEDRFVSAAPTFIDYLVNVR